jgi:hypothetical protein
MFDGNSNQRPNLTTEPSKGGKKRQQKHEDINSVEGQKIDQRTGAEAPALPPHPDAE